MTDGIPHPFEIFYSVEESSYFIFVPDGCVLVNGVAATNDDVDNGNLALDFGETPPEKVYCHVEQVEEEESGEKSWKFTIDGEEEKEGAKYNVLVATFGQSENDGQSYDVVCSAISLGGSGAVVGDYECSEVISGDEEPILVTGHPGEEDAQGHDSHSGLQFMTVGARTDEESGEKIPPKIVARIIDKPEDEDWAAKTMTITPKEGEAKVVHFLGCDDVDIDLSGGGGGEGGDTVVGSDYIEVDDEQDPEDQDKTNKAVKAKINTPNVFPSEEDQQHALLTNDTDQSVRSKKVFLGTGQPASSNRIIIDGPNAKIEVKSADGEKNVEIEAATGKVTLSNGEKRIVLDPSQMPNSPGCNGTVQINSLKFKDKDGNEHTYHGLFCDNIDLTKLGKLIKNTVVTASADPNGMNTIRFNYTDGTYDDFRVMNGLNGSSGSPGKDGETPEITAERQGNHVYIYADGDLIAIIEDGQTPQITAQRTGTKQTTIYANGTAIAVINDGADGSGGDETEEIEVVSGISFEFSSDGKTLNAKVTKKKIKAVFVEDIEATTVKVADADNVDVVVEESYNSDGDYKFKNIRKRVKVLETPTNATGQTVFTTTPLSGENV